MYAVKTPYVNGRGLGILDGKTSGYFLTSVAIAVISGLSAVIILTSDVGNWSSNPKPPSQVYACISISHRNSTSGLNSISR